jgi:hypothetical protein
VGVVRPPCYHRALTMASGPSPELLLTLAPRLASALATVPAPERAPTDLERDGVPATAELRERVAADLARDEEELPAWFVRAVLRALARGTVDTTAAVDRILGVLDGLLATGQVAAAGRAAAALAEEAREAPTAEVEEALGVLVAALGEPGRLARLFEPVANAAGWAEPESGAGHPAAPWLRALDRRAIPALLDLLERVEGAEPREAILAALAELGREDPEPIAARLPSAGPVAAPELLRLLERLEPANRLELLTRALRHRFPGVRREALAALARLRTEAARGAIAATLDDATSELRVEAARILLRLGAERAVPDLLRAIRAPDFGERPAEERLALLRALAESGLPEALAHFRELLGRRGLLGRGKFRDEKLAAVAALAAAPSIATYRLLQGARNDPDGPVAAAALAACEEVRRALVGSGEDRR